jgi:hypothetical protein
MEYCSNIKNEIILFAGSQIELEIVMVSQTQKEKGHIFPLIYGS